jgi:hypothetical protein
VVGTRKWRGGGGGGGEAADRGDGGDVMGERGWRGEVWLACGQPRRFLPFPRHTASRATRAIRSIQAKAPRRRQTRTSCASLESGEDEVVAAVGRAGG